MAPSLMLNGTRVWRGVALAMVGGALALLTLPLASAQWTAPCPGFPPPANDDFANAQVISAVPFAGNGDSNCATMENGEYDPGYTIGQSVWFDWTPAFNGTATVETCNSGFDTVIAVYDTATAAGPDLDNNDQASAGPCAWTNQSYLEWPCVAGTTYHIQLSTYFGSGLFPINNGGPYEIRVSGCDYDPNGPPPPTPPCTTSGPANDCFASPIAVTATPYTNSQSTMNTGTEPSEPSPCGGMASTVWYEWTSPSSGQVTVDTGGSGYDTVLAAYTGTTLPALTTMACNDDAIGLQSRIQFFCDEGVTYRIQVGGYYGAQGSMTLNVGDCLPIPPTCDPVSQTIAPRGTATVRAFGGVAPHSWSVAPSAGVTASSWTGNTFTATYNPVGSYAVTLTDSTGATATCTVNVVPPGCGYTVYDNIPYDFVDLTGVGTGLAHGDDTTIGVSLPFVFEFCGVEYSDVVTSSNGFLCLGASPPTWCGQYWSNGPLPTTSNPYPAVFAYWADLYASNCSSSGPTSCTMWDVQGTAPDRVFLYMAKDEDFFAGPGSVSFEIKLFERTNCIEVHYLDVSDPYGYLVTAGYQDGGAGYTYASTAPGFSRTATAWRACPIPPLTANDDAYVLNEDQPEQALDVTRNDVNSYPGGITITAVSPTVLGTTRIADEDILYTPHPHANGVETFTYNITNTNLEEHTGTVTVVVQAVNDVPGFDAAPLTVLATPAEGTRTVPGWATDVTPSPPTAADEGSQAVAWQVSSNTNPGLFLGEPEVLRSISAASTVTSGATDGSFGLLRFTPSGASGRATVCFVARDDGGAATVTNTWGVPATGVDTTPDERCVEVIENAAPVAYFEPASRTVRPGARLAFDSCPAPAPRCSHDPDGAITNYLWEFGDGDTSSMTMPLHAFMTTGTYKVRLTVWDSYGVFDTHEETVTVAWGESAPLGEDGRGESAPAPLADAGDDRTVVEGSNVQLSGGQRGGSPLATFAWVQVAGPTVALANADQAAPSFVAPPLSGTAPVDLLFALRVADEGRTSAPDYVTVHVVSGNSPPVAKAPQALEVAPGAAVALDGTQSGDADATDSITYSWVQVRSDGEPLVALDGADRATATFTAPAEPVVLRFRLTVTDGKATSQDHATVYVRPAAAQPVEAQPEASRPDTSLAAVHARGIDVAPILWGATAFVVVAALAVALVMRSSRKT
jgi:hypothetical protein